jgi:hypothetical protein
VGLVMHEPSGLNRCDETHEVHTLGFEHELQFDGQLSHFPLPVLAKKVTGHSLKQFPLSSNRPEVHVDVLRMHAPWLLATYGKAHVLQMVEDEHWLQFAGQD